MFLIYLVSFFFNFGIECCFCSGVLYVVGLYLGIMFEKGMFLNIGIIFSVRDMVDLRFLI